MANLEHLQWLLEGPESWNERQKQQRFVPDLAGADICAIFRENGELGREDLIPLARIELYGANLREAILSDHLSIGGVRADLRGAKLQGANLQGAKLTNALLNDACLKDAVLDGADLSNAKLINAELVCADLNGANLCGADLTNTVLYGASLTEANLSWITLTDARLESANLTKAILFEASLWEARLFDEELNKRGGLSASNGTVGSNQYITCIEELLTECRTLNRQHTDHVLYFRGERTNEWELRPSVMRQPENGQISFRERESDMLRDLKSRRPADFSSASSALAEWVLAQHHGLRTRLLDVTHNPLVALFWACLDGDQKQPGRLHMFSVPRHMVKSFNSDSVSVVTNFAKLPHHRQKRLLGRKILASVPRFYTYAMDLLYEKIQQEKPYFKERINPRDFFRVFVVEPQLSFDRIRAQSGAFLISVYHERFERREVLKVNSGIPIYDHFEWEVPHESKHAIRKDLRMLNITRETLLPSLDEAARAVNTGAL